MNKRTTGDGGGRPKPTRDTEEQKVPAGEAAHGPQRGAEGAPDLDETRILPGTGPADITRSLADDATLEAGTSGGSPAIGGEKGRVPATGAWTHLELIEKVGEGGFGETFRARDTNLDRVVALKLLRVEASQQEAVGGQVISEGALLARVRHPNVVSVYGAQWHDGRVGLWMEYVHGRTLESELTVQGSLGLREAALLGVDLCRALSAVHGAGIVHRDIKAANVMREDGGRIVLMDFGLGLDLKAAEMTAAGAVAGTPFYMAPELLRGGPATVRSDIYSVGVLLYRLVTGRYPLTGRTLAELREGHDAGRAVRLRDLRRQGRKRPLGEAQAEPPTPLPETSSARARPSSEAAAADRSGPQTDDGRARGRAPVLGERLAVDRAGTGSQGAERLNEQFVRVVERCLAADPHERYETAQALELALAAAVADLTAYRKGRIAQWSGPRHRLDKDFVALTLMVDQGEESAAGRWSARPERYRDLGELLAAVEDRALVLLGPPGSGKSTLLRRFELEVAEAALTDTEDREPLTFFIQLNYYKPARPGEPPPEPGAWLAEWWSARFPDLPPLPALLDAGRMVLLLDGLNEMASASQGGPGGPREAVVRWKEFLDRLVAERPGNRVIFSCRTLDYSAPLSTASLRVPQVVIEPMTDAQVEQYLVKHSASSAEEGFGGGHSTGATAAITDRGALIWSQLRGTPQLEVMRSPYFLSLLVEQVEAAGGIPRGRAGLFTGFVRRTLRREVERDNPLFAPDGLLTERDVRRIAQGKWSSPWELPERGALIPKLSELAFGMQARSAEGGSSQVRVGYDEALETLGHDRDEEIVKAGEALSVLDEDTGQDEVKFFHQLVQEY